MIQITTKEPKVSMLFDGGCPLCSKEVAHYRRMDKTGEVKWADINANPEILAQYGIGYEAAMRYLHVIDNGKIVVGVPAFAVIWEQLPYYRQLVRIISLPGVMAILDRLYRIFAKKRFARRMACANTGEH